MTGFQECSCGLGLQHGLSSDLSLIFCIVLKGTLPRKDPEFVRHYSAPPVLSGRVVEGDGAKQGAAWETESSNIQTDW